MIWKATHLMNRKLLIVLGGAALATTLAIGPAIAAPGGSGSIGKTTVDTTVAASQEDEMDYGDGIPNGEWITAESKGVEIGLRATDRTDGLLDLTGTNGNRVGVYQASTGFDGTTTNRAEWNYEWSVDLSGATANAAGKTLDDYSLALEQDFVPAYGAFPLPMTQPGVCDVATDTLCQQSWNAMFFDAATNGYDPEAEGTYNLRLVLTPETFNGPPLAVAIQVNVTNA